MMTKSERERLAKQIRLHGSCADAGQRSVLPGQYQVLSCNTDHGLVHVYVCCGCATVEDISDGDKPYRPRR